MAVDGGAIPSLMESLAKEIARRPLVADDIVACIGALTTKFPAGIKLATSGKLGLGPLAEALNTDHPVLARTTLEVLGDMLEAPSPSSTTSAEVLKDLAARASFLTQGLPRCLSSPAAEVRTGALRLCLRLLLSESDDADDGDSRDLNAQTFGMAFAQAGGINALTASLALEPSLPPRAPQLRVMAPPAPDGASSASRRRGQKLMRFCPPACQEMCCFPSEKLEICPPAGGPAPGQPQSPPTRRELAEEALSLLSRHAAGV